MVVGSAVVSALTALVWLLVARQKGDSVLTSVVGWIAVALSALALIFTTLTGHTGTESVWGAHAGSELAPAAMLDGPAAPAQVPSAPEAMVDAPASAAQASPSPNTMAMTLTMAEVAQHYTSASCYTVINGSVYDLTEWIHKHPGGAHGILELCGIDGTHEFMDEHAGFADAMKALDKYKIGELGK